MEEIFQVTLGVHRGARKRYNYLLLSSTCVCDRDLLPGGCHCESQMGSGEVRACHPCSLCRPRRDRAERS